MQRTWLLLLLLTLSATSVFSEEYRVLPSIYPLIQKERAIILTFDDGPRPKINGDILDFLKKENISAAFFFQCWQIDQIPGNKEQVLRAYKEGHEIANHTYGHSYIPKELPLHAKTKDGKMNWLKGKKWIFDDIERCARVIEDVTGQSPKFFRPRSWAIDERYPAEWKAYRDSKYPDPLHQNLKSKSLCDEIDPLQNPRTVFKEELLCGKYIGESGGRYKLVLGRSYFVQVQDNSELATNHRILRDVDTEDWKYYEWYKKNPDEAIAVLVKNIEELIKQREKVGIQVHIIVVHELPGSLKALQILVPKWRAAGYTFRDLRWVYQCEERARC